MGTPCGSKRRSTSAALTLSSNDAVPGIGHAEQLDLAAVAEAQRSRGSADRDLLLAWCVAEQVDRVRAWTEVGDDVGSAA